MWNSSEFIVVNTDVNWKRNPRIAATKKKVCVICLPLLANVNVNKKVPEWFKLGVSDWNDSESEKENDNNFQPSKKRRMKLSAPKGKQCFAQVVYRRKSWRLFPIGTFREKHKVDGLNIYCSPPQFTHSVHFMLPSVVPSTLFGPHQKCTINMQVFNLPLIQNFCGISTIVDTKDDDVFVDSSSDIQL